MTAKEETIIPASDTMLEKQRVDESEAKQAAQLKSYGTYLPEVSLADVQRWAEGANEKLEAYSKRIYSDGKRADGVGGYAPNLKAMKFITG